MIDAKKRFMFFKSKLMTIAVQYSLNIIDMIDKQASSHPLCNCSMGTLIEVTYTQNHRKCNSYGFASLKDLSIVVASHVALTGRARVC